MCGATCEANSSSGQACLTLECRALQAWTGQPRPNARQSALTARQMHSGELDRRRTRPGTAEGRSSGSILILLALRRPTMQPSHLPTLPVQRHTAGPRLCLSAHLSMPAWGAQHARPAGPCRRGVSVGGRGDPRGAFIVSSHGRGARVSHGLFPASPSSPATHGGTVNNGTARARPSGSQKRRRKAMHVCR